MVLKYETKKKAKQIKKKSEVLKLLVGINNCINVLILLIFQALDGFIAVITQDGQLFYVSENVRDFLGYSQVGD